MDGWVTIGTDIDTKKFEKELSRLEKESQKFAKEEEKLLNQKLKLELDTSKTEKDMDNLNAKIENLHKKLQREKNNLNSIPEWKRDSQEYSNQSAKISDLKVQYDTLVSKSDILNGKHKNQVTTLEQISQKLKDNSTSQEEVKNKTEEVKNKIQEVKAASDGIHVNFDNVGKSISDNIKKVGKWALAIFSVRSAYSLIRQAMSTISTYNDDINNKLYSMKMMFASALEPLITRLVNLAWKLMGYVAYIAKAWFGVDLLTKSSANSMKSGAKSAEKMKKSLAGFDEANILNDNGSTGSMGASSPKFEMPETGEIPSWIKWIAENKDVVLGFLKKAGILIAGLKLAKVFGLLKGIGNLKIFGLIAGVALTLVGLVKTVKGVMAFIENPSWKNFIKILEGISLALVGVGVAMVALNATNPIGWILIAVGALARLTSTLFSQETAIKSVEQANKDLKAAQEELKKATDDYTSSLDTYDNALKRVEETARALEEAERKNKITGAELQKQVDEGKLSYDKMTQAQKEVYKAYINNEQAQMNLKKATDDLKTSNDQLKEAKTKEKLATWDAKLAQEAQNKAFKDGGEKAQNFKKSVIDAYEKGELSAEEARDLIGKSMSEMSRDAQKSFMVDLPNAVKEGLNPKNYETFGQKLSKFFSGIWEGIKSGASSAWNWIFGKFGGNFSGNPRNAGGGGGGRGFAKGGIYYPKLQYHASGGIINRPGKGVPITEHIGGERGAEGILPLTDSQQMDLLGQSIAKYMTINLTNNIQMNGRMLSKEIKKIQAEQDFATNS